MPSRLGAMRLGASRLGYYDPIRFLTINGITRQVRRRGLVIRDILNGTPNTMTMRVSGFTPLKGHEVLFRLGSPEPSPSPREFAGHILTATQIYEAHEPRNVAWDLSCISYEWRLNHRKVTAKFSSVSATTVLQAILAGWTSGFTATIDAGLSVLDEMTFTNEDVTDCLDRICRRIGSDWKLVDTDLRVPASAGETANAITDSDPHGMRGLAVTTDLSQVRTRQQGEGGGSTVSVDVGPGQATIPVDEGPWYSPTGGLVVSGPQRIAYTGTSSMDGSGSTVAGQALAPGTAVAAVVAGAAGKLSVGAYQYQSTFVLPQGESEPSAASSAATITDVTAPTAPSGVATSGVLGNLTVGAFLYKVTYETAAGETVASAASASVSIADIATPSAPSGVVVSETPGNMAVGAYAYKVTYETSAGETVASVASSSVSVPDVSTPSAPSGVVVANTSGNLGAGTYLYKVTYETAAGETVASAASFGVAVADVAAPTAPSVALLSGIGKLIGAYSYKVSYVTASGATLPGSAGSRTAVAISTPAAPSRAQSSNTLGGLTGGGAYLWKVGVVTALGETISSASSSLTIAGINAAAAPSGGSVNADGSIPTGQRVKYAVGFIAPDNTDSTGLATGWFTLTAGNQTVTLTGIPIGPTRTIARRVYRFSEFGAWNNWYFVGQINDNTATTYVDEAATVGALYSSGTTPGQVALSSIPTGPTGTLARRIYRTKAGGSAYYLVGQIDNNSTSTFTDTIPDTALTVSAPLVATAGGEQHTVTIPTGPTGTLARRLWRTDSAGGSTYRFLAELADNTTTTYADNVADASLGDAPPLVSTAVGGQVTVTIPVSADDRVTKRTIYRTEVNGATYYKLTTVNDNSDPTILDNVADANLGGIPPATGTAGTGRITLTIPVSADARVTKRGIYRTAVGGSDYKRIATVSDNTAAAFADNASDSARGVAEPATSTAGSGQIGITSIPVGPAGTTSRRLYRTEAGGTNYKYVLSVSGNVTTTATDNVADTTLGESAHATSTVGALAGDTALRIADLSLVMSAGWVRVGDQLLWYTGRSAVSGAGTITGIPASGVGSIGAGIASDVSVVNHPHLVGVTGVLYAITSGDPLNVCVIRNDVAAQAVMAALLTTPTHTHDGIIEGDVIQDGRMTETEIAARCDAKLLELKDPIVSVRYETRDKTTQSGREVMLALGGDTNISGTFTIQSVTTLYGESVEWPWRQVEASSRRMSFDQLLRLIKQKVT